MGPSNNFIGCYQDLDVDEVYEGQESCEVIEGCLHLH